MWSLFKRKECEDGEEGVSNSGVAGIFDYSSLTEKDGHKLEPLKFTNGKTQADVVKEVLDAIEKGNKIIFIKGVCGTGKSSIALNLARHFKKTSIVVPIKSLQEQYEKDYTQKMFILKQDGKKMDISVIKGRNNFTCPFVGGRCDEDDLPCTIELREKNMDKIKEFIEMNDSVSKFDFSSISEVRRMSVAPACPYWSPLLPSEVNTRALEKAKKIKYDAVCGEKFALFQRKRGCKYYDQYESYAESDVLIFNSAKYLLEMAIGRKPKTDLDVIDECDEFLDNFANEKKINLNRLVMALSNLFPDTREKKDMIKEMIFMANSSMFDLDDDDNKKNDNIIKINDSKVLSLIKKIIDNPYLAEEEENNYYNNVFEIAKSFENLLDDTYVSFDKVSSDRSGQKGLFGNNFKQKNEDTVFVNLVSINLAQKFKDIVDANNVLVLMSGTLHSESVLKDIFGLDSFKVIEAELELPGTITKYRTGLERNCSYESFKAGRTTRKHYLKALDACVGNAKPPVLIHVNAFDDLPSDVEKDEFKLDSLISKEDLKGMQEHDRDGKNIDKFKSGQTDLLFTTKCSRGVDFPGDKCNSIILTKYPYPNIQGLFWKILKKENPEKFFEFYYDKASRELIQKIARGVRFKGDHVLLLSPDSRVLDAKL